MTAYSGQNPVFSLPGVASGKKVRDKLATNRPEPGPATAAIAPIANATEEEAGDARLIVLAPSGRAEKLHLSGSDI